MSASPSEPEVPTERESLAEPGMPSIGDQPTLTNHATPSQGKDLTRSHADGRTWAPSDNVTAPQGYKLVGELGRGGMGVVYQAIQTKLNRTVALKMVLGRGDTKEFTRFLTEAEVVASVRHPHVVQVYEFGDHDGQPFMAMEYLPGGSLSQRIRREGRMPPAQAAELVIKLARGVQAAHEQGIVHRDLKPGNVLFDESGEPKVTDFGLAKRGQSQELTQTGAIMGTPAYMAPEQARGDTKFVGPGADVYALGVMLFELLTGKRPFDDPDAIALIMKVATASPPTLRSLHAEIPRDLELITLKCLAKTPAERYASAGLLAEELQRFLNGEPVSVRPAGVVERSVKLAKRYPAISSLLGVLFLGGIVGVISITLLYFRAEYQRQQADQIAQQLAMKSQDLERANEQAQRDRDQATKRALEADQARKEAQRTTAGFQLERGLSLTNQGELPRALLWMARALQTAPTDDRDLQRSIRANIAAWEPYAPSLVHSINLNPYSPPANASDQTTGTYYTPAPLTPAQRGNQELAAVAFSPDGRLAAFNTTGNKLQLWDMTTRQAIGPSHAWFPPYLGQLSDRGRPDRFKLPDAIHFSPDGQRLIFPINPNDFSMIDTASGQIVASLLGVGSNICQVDFSPDGTRFITSGMGQLVREWDLSTGKPVDDIPKLPSSEALAALSISEANVGIAFHKQNLLGWSLQPDGVKRTLTPTHTDRRVSHFGLVAPHHVMIIMTDISGTTRLERINLLTGDKHEATVDFPAQNMPRIAAREKFKWFLVGDDNRSQLWDAETLKPVGQPQPRTGVSFLASLQLSGSLLLQFNPPNSVQNQPGSVHVWDTSTGEVVSQPIPIPVTEARSSFSFVAAGKSLLQTSIIGKFKLYESRTGKLLNDALPSSTLPGRWLIPSSEDVAYGLTDQGIQAIHLTTGKPDGPPLATAKVPQKIAFSPDEKQLVCFGAGNHCEIWDLTQRKRLAELTEGEFPAMSSTQQYVQAKVTHDGQSVLRLWNTSTGEPLQAEIPLPESNVTPLQVGANRLVYFVKNPEQAEYRGVLKVFDILSGKLVGEWPHHGIETTTKDKKQLGGRAKFDPAKLCGVTVPKPDELALWDLNTGQRRGPIHKLPGPFLDAEFNANGDRLIVSLQTGKIRIFDAKQGQPIGDEFSSIRFDPALASPGYEKALGGERWVIDLLPRAVQILDPKTAKPLSVAISVLPAARGGDDYTYSKDGRYLIARQPDRNFTVYDCESGRHLGIISPPDEPPTFACYLPGNRLLFSRANRELTTMGSSPSQAYVIWNRATQRAEKALFGQLQVSADGKTLGLKKSGVDRGNSKDPTDRPVGAQTDFEVYRLTEQQSSLDPTILKLNSPMEEAILTPDGQHVVRVSQQPYAVEVIAVEGLKPLGQPVMLGPKVPQQFFNIRTWLDATKTRLLIEIPTSTWSGAGTSYLLNLESRQVMKKDDFSFDRDPSAPSGYFVAGDRNLLMIQPTLALVSAQTGQEILNYGPQSRLLHLSDDRETAVITQQTGIAVMVNLRDGTVLQSLRQPGTLMTAIRPANSNLLTVLSRSGMREDFFNNARGQSETQQDHLRVWKLPTTTKSRVILDQIPTLIARYSEDNTRVEMLSITNLNKPESMVAQHLWDITTRQPIVLHGMVSQGLTATAISPNGEETVIPIPKDRSEKPWLGRLHLTTGSMSPLEETEAATLVSYTPDGKQVIVGAANTALTFAEASRQPKLKVPHQGVVLALAISDDQQLVASADDTGEIKVWELDSGKIRQLWKVGGMVLAMQFDRSGKSVIVGTGSYANMKLAPYGEVVVFSLETGSRCYNAVKHRGAVSVIQVSPDGERVLTAGEDGQIRIITVADGKPVPYSSTLQHGSAIQAGGWHPQGQYFFTAGSNGSAKIWASENGQLLHELRHDGPIVLGQFSPDGRWLVTAGDDPAVKVWSVETWTQAGETLPQLGKLESLSLSRDGNRLVVGVAEIAGSAIWTIPAEGLQAVVLNFPKTRNAIPASELMLEPMPGETRYLAKIWRTSQPNETNENRWLRVFDLKQNHVVGADVEYSALVPSLPQAKKEAKPIPLENSDRGLAWAISPDHSLIALCVQQELQLFSLADGKARGRRVKLPDRLARGLAFSPDGQRLAVGLTGGAIVLVDVKSQEILPTRCFVGKPVFNVVFSPSGRQIVAVGTNDASAKLFDLESGQPIGEPLTHQAGVISMVFAPNGQFLATGSIDRTIRLWDPTSGKPLGRPLQHEGMIYTIAISPDSRQLLGLEIDEARRFQGNLRIWTAPVPMADAAADLESALQRRFGFKLDGIGGIELLDLPPR